MRPDDKFGKVWKKSAREGYKRGNHTSSRRDHMTGAMVYLTGLDGTSVHVRTGLHDGARTKATRF